MVGTEPDIIEICSAVSFLHELSYAAPHQAMSKLSAIKTDTVCFPLWQVRPTMMAELYAPRHMRELQFIPYKAILKLDRYP
jgi:hypothetical protein